MNGIIYKITNKINGKVYIGLTTVSLHTRWNGHKTSARKAILKEINHPLYNAMAKYGVENFTIQQIDESDNFVKLGELERKYIKEYNSTNREYGYNVTRGGEKNGLDGNPRANLTVEDVANIRKIYSENSIGPVECWNKFYRGKISYSAFEKIYEGQTWKSIMPEVYSLENKILHRRMKSNTGEKNGNAILTKEEVYKIRKYYVNHTLKECYLRFGKNFSSIKSFRAIIDKSYLDVPVYSKTLKRWMFNDERKKRIPQKSNPIIVENGKIQIVTFDDYGRNNGLFLTNSKFYNLVKTHIWKKFSNGKLYTTTNEKKVVFLHELIMDSVGRRVYYVNGNLNDVREENLVTDRTDYKIKKYGYKKFKDACLNENFSLRGLGRETGVSPQSLVKYIEKNNIMVSENKRRK